MTEGGAPFASGKYNQRPSDTNEPETIKPSEMEEMETYPTKPSSYIWVSILALFYNVAFGLIALVFSMLSDNAWSRDDAKTARKYGRIALVLCLMGLVVTVLIIIIIPVVQVHSMS